MRAAAAVVLAKVCAYESRRWADEANTCVYPKTWRPKKSSHVA